MNLSSNLIGNYNHETNFPHEQLLTDTQVSKIRKGFPNDSSAYIKFLKTQLPRMIQSGRSLGDLLAAIQQVIFLTGVESLKIEVKKGVI